MDLSKMTETELRKLNREVMVELKLKKHANSLRAVAGFTIGDSITIDHKSMIGITAKVTKVNRVKLVVDVGGKGYTVPASMCTKIESWI